MSAAADDKYVTEIAAFVARTRWDDIPETTRHQCTRSFVDSVGCVVGGGRHALVKRATDTLAGFFGPLQASLLGQGGRSDLFHAALINGTAGAAYSFFDNYSAAHLHAGASHVAALLAIAEWKDVSGADLLLAYALGLEVACRLTKAIGLPPAEMDIGWSTGGIVNGLSSALAAGRLLRLSQEQLVWAFGIAASQAAGLRVAHGSMTASLLYGQAAQVGVRAAVMAAGGFTSPAHTLQGRFGYAELFSKKPHLPALLDRLGAVWELELTNYKPYPTDIAIHPAIEAMLRLKRQHGLNSSDISRIRLEASDLAVSFCDRPEPADDLEAKFSLQHWVAAAAAYGTIGLKEGANDIVHDPEIKRLRSIIELTKNGNFAWDAAVLRLDLEDGRHLELPIEHCLGSPTSPMSDADIDEKFISQVSISIGADRARQLSKSCWNLKGVASVAVLAGQAR